MQPSRMISLGGLLAALAVGLGAVGAHALKGHLTPEQLQTFHTAVQYQMIHAIGLVLVGLLSLHQPGRFFSLAGWTMLLGIVLFSGFLYAWIATQQKFFVHLVPVGGVSLILGWVFLTLGAFGLGSK